MPLFGGQRPPQPTEAERQAAEVDLERIRQGGIPLGAEQRLKRVAAASTPFFTSDLSAKEYALAQASGLQPVAQVMGSSVVQHGWNTYQPSYYGYSQEVRALSDPWNLARSRAFDRLQEEARCAAADAVIGIEMSASGSVGDANNVEFVVFGTAVRDNAFGNVRSDLVRTCTLSGQEVDKLRRNGAEPCGVIGHTCVVVAQLQPNSNYILNSSGWLGGAGSMNAEIPEISQGVYDARQRVMAEAKRQALEVDGNRIVISTLTHSIEHREYEQPGGIRINYFFVTMHVLGTAIQVGAHAPYPAPMREPVLSINLGT